MRSMYRKMLGWLIVGLLVVSLPFAAAGKKDKDDEEAEWDVSNPPGKWETVSIDTTETT